MNKYKLGKLPARLEAVKFKFGTFFNTEALPVPPMRLGHELIGHPWGVLGNDQHSNCVFAGAAHEEMVWTHSGTKGIGANFTTDNVLSDYAAVTGYDGTEETDQGADMVSSASYRRRIGILDDQGVRHKVDAYMALRPGSGEDLALAVYLTGAVGIGIQVPANAERLFELRQPWDVTANQRIEGGHYIPVIGRNSNGMWLVVTWGRIQGMTQAFYEKYCDEALIYISLETIQKTGLTAEGFAIDDVRKHLAQLGN